MSEQAKCEICGEPMPPGEEMFKMHGYSGNCPKPSLPKEPQFVWLAARDEGSDTAITEVMGVFSTEAKADAACTREMDWYARIPIDEVAPENKCCFPFVVWPRAGVRQVQE